MITVEELDIVVQTSVEQALTEFKKIVPQLKKTMKQVENNLNKVETKGMVTKVQQAVQQVKQKVNEVKNTGVDKQLQAQFNRAGVSVEKYQGQLEDTKEKLRQVYAEMDNIQTDTWKQYTPEGVELGNKAIEPTVNNALGNNKQYQGLSKEAIKLEQQIASLNSKLNTTKQEYSQIAGQIQEVTSKQGVWGNAVNKVRSIIDNVKKNIKGTKDNFEGVSAITEKVKNGCSQILGVTAKVTTRIKQMGTGFKKGLVHILKYAAALFSLQSIYSGLSNTANAWLSSQNQAAKQLSANIDYMKYALGSALAPAIQFVINLIYQLLKAIQSVVYALTGINIFAKASAKSYASMASSAKKAAKETKQLAGVHDEINNIQETDPESGSSGGGSVAPSFDLSQVDSQMSAFAQKLYDFFKPLKESWDKYGPELVAQIKTTAGQAGYLISSVWGSFEKIITNGTVYSILENILAIIGNIAQAWANAWNYNNNGDAIVQNLANAFNNLLVAINNVVSSPEFQEWLNNCSDKFREISEKIASIDWQPLVDALFEIGQSVGTLALDILSGLVDVFKWLAENPIIAEIILGIAVAIGVLSTAFTVITTVVGFFTAAMDLLNISLLPLIAIIAVIALIVLAIMNWDTITKALADTWEWIKQKAQEIWNAISDFFVNLWQGICDTATNVWNGIKDFFENVWTSISNFFSSIWNGIKDTASNIWNGIKNIFSEVGSWFTNIFQQAYNGITNIFNNIGSFFSGIWNNIKNTFSNLGTSIGNAISGAVKSGINGVISLIEKTINNAISLINGGISLINLIPGVNIGRIGRLSLPRLATGAVLKVPTVAEMAEYPGASTNPEIVTPQNIMEETFDRVLSRYQNNNPSSNEGIRQLIIQFGSHKVAVEMESLIKQAHRRNGTASITI